VSELSERLAGLREQGDFAGIVAEIPYARWIGFTVEQTAEGLVGKLAFSDKLIGNPALPALHGGTIGALLESTAIFQVLWAHESIVLPKTISITVDYLRSGRPVDTFASATITKRGRRVVNVRAEAWQDDRGAPIAAAHAHFLVKNRDA
jgi:acyl-coenzyme A thioesterase PaaI-like protein